MTALAPHLSTASMLIGAGSAVAGYLGQRQQAGAQTRANAEAAESALRARNQQAQQIETRAWQERDAASERIFADRIKALEGEGAARAHGAARGIEGTTVDALARDYWARQGRAEAAITKTQNNITQQLAAEAQGAQATYESRVNALPPVSEPSLWGLGLGIGDAAVKAGRDAVLAETRNPAPKRS